MTLSAVEKQILATMSLLTMRGQAADGNALDAGGNEYFGMYRLDWTDSCTRLIELGLLRLTGDHYALTAEGQPIADALRVESPKHLYFYNEYFTRTEHSQAHAAFCQQVYGANLCQHGMMDIEQTHRLIDILSLNEQSRVLELGCGNGMIAEYISDRTRAHVTGVDITTVGIAQATRRVISKTDRLTFIAGDMLAVALPPHAFDTIIAIDAVSFVGDLDRLLSRVRAAARPGGQMGVFYSAWAAASDSKDALDPHANRFALALHRAGLAYETFDFSTQEAEHWKRKLCAVSALRPEFEAEGNTFLYERRLIEAQWHQQYVIAGNVRRYLYHVRL